MLIIDISHLITYEKAKEKMEKHISLTKEENFAVLLYIKMLENQIIKLYNDLYSKEEHKKKK